MRCAGAESVVVVSPRQQHAELAESGNQECAGEVQESPKPFSIPIAGQSANANGELLKKAPPDPVLPATSAIPGVLAAGQSWKVVWSWEGNNVDGPIAGDNGTVLFANNDASNVMQMDPRRASPRSSIATRTRAARSHAARTGRCSSRNAGSARPSSNWSLSERCWRTRSTVSRSNAWAASINDLMADARGGVYFSVTGATGSGVFYADPKGVVSQYGKDVPLANGIILSPDEKTLYVTNGATVYAFDVKADGSLANQREFGKLRGGEGGDGSAVDQQGRVYIATGKSVDVFAPDGNVRRQHPRSAGAARHVLRRPRQENALRHRVLWRMGNAERSKPHHRDSDDRAGLYRASEVGASDAPGRNPRAPGTLRPPSKFDGPDESPGGEGSIGCVSRSGFNLEHRPGAANSHYIRSMIAFRVALGRIAATHLSSSGK